MGCDEIHLPDTIRTKISDEPGVVLEIEPGLLSRDVYVLNKHQKSKQLPLQKLYTYTEKSMNLLVKKKNIYLDEKICLVTSTNHEFVILDLYISVTIKNIKLTKFPRNKTKTNIFFEFQLFQNGILILEK